MANYIIGGEVVGCSGAAVTIHGDGVEVRDLKIAHCGQGYDIRTSPLPQVNSRPAASKKSGPVKLATDLLTGVAVAAITRSLGFS